MREEKWKERLREDILKYESIEHKEQRIIINSSETVNPNIKLLYLQWSKSPS